MIKLQFVRYDKFLSADGTYIKEFEDINDAVKYLYNLIHNRRGALYYDKWLTKTQRNVFRKKYAAYSAKENRRRHGESGENR